MNHFSGWMQTINKTLITQGMVAPELMVPASYIPINKLRLKFYSFLADVQTRVYFILQQ